MRKKRQNFLMNHEVSMQKNNRFSSPKKRTFLSVVTPSKSKERNNKTQSSIKVDFNLSYQKNNDHNSFFNMENSNDSAISPQKQTDVHQRVMWHRKNRGGRHNKHMSMLLDDFMYEDQHKKRQKYDNCLWNSNSPVNKLME